MKNLSAKEIQRLRQMFAAAQQAEKSGQLLPAERLYTDILKDAPQAIEARNALAILFINSNRHAEAAKQFKLILKDIPNHANTHFNLANAYYSQDLLDEAVKHYLLAIQFDPNMKDAYIHLGITYRKQKSPEMAIPLFKKALDIDKKNAFAFFQLGSAYEDIGDLPRSLECLEAATGLDPNNSNYRIGFGLVLAKAELTYEATEQLYKACYANPNDVEAFCILANDLNQKHRYDDAVEALNRAKTLTPDNPEVFDLFGSAYLGMSDTDAALKSYEFSLQLSPNRIASLHGIGQVHQELGNIESGLEIAKKLISLDSTSPLGYLLSSRLSKAKEGDEIASQLVSLLEHQELSEENIIAIHFALGKTYDDLKQHAAAFEYYSIGNALVNKKQHYTKAWDTKRFDDLMNVYTTNFFKSHQGIGVSDSSPIFIIGMPRSGTTLTEQIISSHPDVIGAGEVSFWSGAYTALPIRLSSTNPYPECMSEINAEVAHSIAEKYLETLRKIAGPQTNPKHITDKLPHNFMQLGLIALLFPNAKIIHTRRDPIDTCLSIYFQNFAGDHRYAYDLENLGHHYLQYQRLMAHWHKVLPVNIFDVDYEETISNPEDVSRALINHIGLDWNDACLAPHKLERSVKTASHWQVRQPIYKTSVQRWKAYEPYLEKLITSLNS